ncbi:MAG: transcriptional repressor [Clostridiales bacterium]|nr:transcriptional repressor [Clostridiales bacterium]
MDNENISMQDMRKQEILQCLRKMNFRITKQRALLLDIVLAGNCSCCKEIYYEAVKKDVEIGIATVYRMINILEEIGVISRNRLSQIEYKDCGAEGEMYRIVFDDKTEITLSEKKWRQVVASGLRSCGFAGTQDLKSIEYGKRIVDWEKNSQVKD